MYENFGSRAPYFWENTGFTGRQLDILDGGSLKIQYNRNRYYDQQTGRWFTQDPIGYVDGLNLYQYCRGRPVVGLDAYGNLSSLIGSPLEYSLAAAKALELARKGLCAAAIAAILYQTYALTEEVCERIAEEQVEVAEEEDPTLKKKPVPPIYIPLCSKDSEPESESEPEPEPELEPEPEEKCKKEPETGECTFEQWKPLYDAQKAACAAEKIKTCDDSR